MFLYRIQVAPAALCEGYELLRKVVEVAKCSRGNTTFTFRLREENICLLKDQY
jgi:hypothetical protein